MPITTASIVAAGSEVISGAVLEVISEAVLEAVWEAGSEAVWEALGRVALQKCLGLGRHPTVTQPSTTDPPQRDQILRRLQRSAPPEGVLRSWVPLPQEHSSLKNAVAAVSRVQGRGQLLTPAQLRTVTTAFAHPGAHWAELVKLALAYLQSNGWLGESKEPHHESGACTGVAGSAISVPPVERRPADGMATLARADPGSEKLETLRIQVFAASLGSSV